jgi:hypothetical protein
MCVYAHISSKFVTHIDIGFRKEELISSQVFTRPPEVPVVVVETTVTPSSVVWPSKVAGGWAGTWAVVPGPDTTAQLPTLFRNCVFEPSKVTASRKELLEIGWYLAGNNVPWY